VDDKVWLALAETLSARLCHDLISPVGAIANGVEILEEESEFAEDAIRLIADSTRSANRRLRFYREAYGSRGGGESRARAAAIDFFQDGKITCAWPEAVSIPSHDLEKLACNLLLLASETLPRGGRIGLSAAPPEYLLRVTASGTGATAKAVTLLLRETNITVDELTPRSVQTIFTRLLAARSALVIDTEEDEEKEISLTIRPVKHPPGGLS
jgi:histidine phosphotransferase ChpT